LHHAFLFATFNALSFQVVLASPMVLYGKHLGADAAVTSMASFVSFLVSAACLGREPASWQFSVIFAFSALAGATSLSFLKRIPDVDPPERGRENTEPVPWGAMMRFAPFRKLLRMAVMWSVANGGMGTFTVAYLKVIGGMPDCQILLVTAFSFLGGLCSLWFLGSRLDVLGSRPVLGFSFFMWALVAAGWSAIAGELVSPGLVLVLVLQFMMGLFAALVQMSNLRLAMAVIPEMGRGHFFALFTVLTSLALGLSPIFWGIIIDAIGTWKAEWLGVVWNRYTFFFGAVVWVFLGALGLATRLEEPDAVSMEGLLREILIESPQRVWLRFWPRA